MIVSAFPYRFCTSAKCSRTRPEFFRSFGHSRENSRAAGGGADRCTVRAGLAFRVRSPESSNAMLPRALESSRATIFILNRLARSKALTIHDETIAQRFNAGYANHQ